MMRDTTVHGVSDMPRTAGLSTASLRRRSTVCDVYRCESPCTTTVLDCCTDESRWYQPHGDCRLRSLAAVGQLVDIAVLALVVALVSGLPVAPAPSLQHSRALKFPFPLSRPNLVMHTTQVM